MPTRLPPNPLVYEINTRVWLRELSARQHHPIKLDSIPEDELEHFSELGVDALWLMGVWTTGARAQEIACTHPDLQNEFRAALSSYTVEDCAGSPYAVSSYVVSPQLGGAAALARLRERLARRNIGLILDFVCNHTACDHHSIREKPEAFVMGTEADLNAQPDAFFRSEGGHIIAHGRDPFFPPWTDTAQLNYASETGREMMLSKLFCIADQCDGVRCDMAMLILPQIFRQTWGARLGNNAIERSFWREAIPNILSRHPSFVFIAESYWDKEAELQREGFHFTYDKTLYDRLLHHDYNGVRQHLRAVNSFQQHCVRFVENHDEARAAHAFGVARSIAAATVSYFTPGMKLFHEGQLEGRTVKVPVQLVRRAVESDNPETEVAYQHMLSVLNEPMLQTGVYRQIDVSPAGYGDRTNEAVVALLWTPGTGANGNSEQEAANSSSVTASGFHCSGRSKKVAILVVVNLSGSRAYGRVPFPQEICSLEKKYVFDDRFAGKRYDRDGGELLYPGLYVALEGYQPHLFEVCEKA